MCLHVFLNELHVPCINGHCVVRCRVELLDLRPLFHCMCAMAQAGDVYYVPAGSLVAVRACNNEVATGTRRALCVLTAAAADPAGSGGGRLVVVAATQTPGRRLFE